MTEPIVQVRCGSTTHGFSFPCCLDRLQDEHNRLGADGDICLPFELTPHVGYADAWFKHYINCLMLQQV